MERATDATQLVGSIQLADAAVATSGTYARGAHLYGPEPVPEGSITVVGPRITWADIRATALFVGAPSPEPGYGVVVDQRRAAVI